jgi:hypothetical protein
MYIEQTKKWVESMVIALNFCPFAQREMDNNSVRIEASTATNVEDGLLHFMHEINYLNENSTTGTTLLVFPHCLQDFFDYLDFVDFAHDLLAQHDYESIYQLATFHPDYCFAGAAKNDVSNYTNRSPYPMLHILREEMLDRAIAYYGDTEKIPENNIKCLQELGLAEVKERLQKCMNISK